MALRRDVFPAEVTLPDGRLLTGVRAFVTDSRLVVWSRGANTGVHVDEFPIENNPVTADRSTLQRGRRLEVVLADGPAFVNRGHGCGCGSPLKQGKLEDVS